METDVTSNRHKVCDLDQRLSQVILENESDNLRLNNGITEWFYDEMEINDMLKSGSCYAVVCRSFFHEDSDLILSFWIFAADKRTLGRGRYVAHVGADLQSTFAAQLCGGLGVLESIKILWKNMKEDSKLRFSLVSDCKIAL